MANINILTVQPDGKKKRLESENQNMSLSSISIGGASGPVISEASGNFDFNNNKLSNVDTPTSALDAANKQYVDNTLADLDTENFINVEGSTILAGKVVYENNIGQIMLAGATSPLNIGTTLGVTAESIDNLVSGRVIIKPGATVAIPGASLVINMPVYISRSTPGELVQSLVSFTDGDNVVKVGTAYTANSIIFDPEYIVEY